MNATWLMAGFSWLLLAAVADAQLNTMPRPDREGRPGPWDNDVLAYRLPANGRAERLATFERAGVPTMARLQDRQLIAAFRYFP